MNQTSKKKLCVTIYLTTTFLSGIDLDISDYIPTNFVTEVVNYILRENFGRTPSVYIWAFEYSISTQPDIWAQNSKEVPLGVYFSSSELESGPKDDQKWTRKLSNHKDGKFYEHRFHINNKADLIFLFLITNLHVYH